MATTAMMRLKANLLGVEGGGGGNIVVSLILLGRLQERITEVENIPNSITIM